MILFAFCLQESAEGAHIMLSAMWIAEFTVNNLTVFIFWFTVKSADSGIQNSADGSRERLTNTPSNNSIADAGKIPT